jgi:uncharacterized protein (DUF2141 family)
MMAVMDSPGKARYMRAAAAGTCKISRIWSKTIHKPKRGGRQMRKFYIVMFGTLMLMPVMAEAELAKLTVTIRGLEPATGTLEVSLFNSADTFLKKPLLQNSEPVEGQEEITSEFTGLTDGDYAVVVVHDENDNGVLDTGFLGFGGESYGYSNNAYSWLARPSFDAAHFTIGTEDQQIEIDLD